MSRPQLSAGRSARASLKRIADKWANETTKELIASISAPTTKKRPSPPGGPPGKRSGRLISAVKKSVIVSGNRLQARVYIDRRIAKYAGWLEQLFNRPYFASRIPEWLTKLEKMLDDAQDR